jgi:hypothetical protein
MAKIAVATVPAAIVEKGKLQIVARTRVGKDKKEIPADQRSRSILIPEFTPNVSSKYTSLVVAALSEGAKTQLAAQWEAEPMLREVDDALYTEDAILGYLAREAESKKLSAIAINAWYEQSELRKEMLPKYNEAQIKKFAQQLENIAAPVPSYTEEAALKRIVSLGKHERDAEHEVCAQMIAKLNRHVESMRKQRADMFDMEEMSE